METADFKSEYMPAISPDELNDHEVLEEIHSIKEQLSDEVLVLGHHYQQDDIIRFADVTGDSLALSFEAQKAKQKNIIFCGVHFMAETADILTGFDQQVFLPDLRAGCSMADMAIEQDVEKAWEVIHAHTSDKVVPITYINCAASLKAFVGRHNGSICTSSNAAKVVDWALGKGEKLFFFPDQHLGRNTSFELGVPLESMVVYDPRLPQGGLSQEEIKRAKVILWYGYCSVHQGFKAEHIDFVREKSPEAEIIVHPECSFDVVRKADFAGSTAALIKKIEQAPKGTEFAVGTEINLVNRLRDKFKGEKKVSSLSPYQCLCTTMYRVRPRWLLESFRSIKRGEGVHRIQVDAETARESLKALETMLNLS